VYSHQRKYSRHIGGDGKHIAQKTTSHQRQGDQRGLPCMTYIFMRFHQININSSLDLRFKPFNNGEGMKPLPSFW